MFTSSAVSHVLHYSLHLCILRCYLTLFCRKTGQSASTEEEKADDEDETIVPSLDEICQDWDEVKGQKEA